MSNSDTAQHPYVDDFWIHLRLFNWRAAIVVLPMFGFILLLLLQQVVLNVLSPKVMSQSVGMHPLLVLLALLVGANLAGVWGAVFAVPVAGVIVAMLAFYRMTVGERKLRLDARGEEANQRRATAVPVPNGQGEGSGVLDS